MKRYILTGLVSTLCLCASPLKAQETSDITKLQQQMLEMKQAFEEQQRLYQAQLEAMQKQIEALKTNQQQSDSAQQRLERQVDSVRDQASASPVSTPTVEPRGWSPTDGIGFRSGNASMDLSLTGTFVVGSTTADDIEELNGGGHDPAQRGFTAQAVEANFRGAVDPYFRGQANLAFFLDQSGETRFEMEEAWLETSSLPANLQVQAGQVWSIFGRHNYLHNHSWDFVDQPLMVTRYLGEDGLRNPGARLSWLAPLPFFTEFMVGVQNSAGETAQPFRGEAHAHGGEEEEEEELPMAFRHQDNDRGVKNLGDMLYTPRLEMSFDLTDTQTLLVGGSGAFGPNNSGASGDTDTRLYGADVTWKWQPRDHQGGFPFVSMQSEFLVRNYQAGFFDWDEDGNGGDGDADGFVDEGILTDPLTGLPAVLTPETLTDYGLYSQLLYGFKRGWVAGLRGDYLWARRGQYEMRGLGLADGAGGIDPVGIDLERGSRWRISPNLTWYPTEFSKIRLQYNYDNRDQIGVDHSLWLQFEMALGAHAAHKF